MDKKDYSTNVTSALESKQKASMGGEVHGI
jgi:hypothetical protein